MFSPKKFCRKSKADLNPATEEDINPAISCKSDKICTVWTPKTLICKKRHNRIHICPFESRMLNHLNCIKKGEQSLFDIDSICYRNCCGTEQSIHHIYTNFLNCKLHMVNISRWYLGFFEHKVFFLQMIATGVKSMQCFWQKKQKYWWPTCIKWDFQGYGKCMLFTWIK